MNPQMLITLFLTGGPWGLVGGVIGYILGMVIGWDAETLASIGCLIGFSSPLWWPAFKKS